MPTAGRATKIPRNMFQDTKCFCFNFTVWEEANWTFVLVFWWGFHLSFVLFFGGGDGGLVCLFLFCVSIVVFYNF